MNNLLVVSLDFFASNPLITLTTTLFKIPKERAMNFFFSDFFFGLQKTSDSLYFFPSLFLIAHSSLLSVFILILIWRRYYSWTWWRHFVHIYIYIYIYFGFAEDFRFIIFLPVYLIELDKSLLGNNLGTLVFTFFSDFYFYFFWFTEEFRFIIFLPFSVFYSIFFPSLCFLF